MQFGVTVKESGQDLARGTHCSVHTLEAFHDASVGIDQDDVGIPAHQLRDQAAAGRIAELVRAVERQLRDAVATRLRDVRNERTGEIFAQEHAKHRRLLRVFAGRVRVLQARRGGVRADEQAVRARGAVEREEKLIALGLVDFVDARAGQTHFAQQLA